MAFCLLPAETRKFLAAIHDGRIDPEKMVDMSSAERRAFFAKIVGEDNAHEVNALLESKLLLKDQQRGMVSWAKKVAGISKATRDDMISRIEKMDRVLDASDEHSFLADLAAKKLGTALTFEEAKNVADLSRVVSDTRDAIKTGAHVGDPSRIEHGAAYVALQNYVHELKLANTKPTIRSIAKDIKGNPIGSVGSAIHTIAGTAKSLKASFDDSFAGRQGFKTIFTNPVLWANNFVRTFGYIGKSLLKPGTDHSVMDAIKADVYSRPNALNGNYKAMKLDIGLTTEEAFPSALPEHTPIFGRLYKASETAFNGMGLRLRADIADKVIKIAENNGHDLSASGNIESLGKLVNSLTGRGSLGQFEKVGKAVNTLFFSPKFVKSNIDFLTAHLADPTVSGYAKRQAARNLLKVTAGVGTILAVASALWPGSVDFDPRSADFGKIKIGNTRFDVSGGMSSLVTLAARVITQSSKSSTTGKVTSLNSGKFGAPTAMDAMVNFAENKASPVASVLIDYLRGRTFQGEKPTLANEAYNFLTPLEIQNAQELYSNPDAADPIIAMIADVFGISTNTYGGGSAAAPPSALDRYLSRQRSR